MGVKINRGELLNALGRVMPGVSKTGTVEQSSCVVFQDSWLSSFDNEICCRTKLDLTADLEVAVRAEPLLEWLDKIKEEELELSHDGNELLIRAGKIKCGIRAEAEIVLPIGEVETPDSWQLLPENFFTAVEQVMGSVGTPADDFMVRCVHFHPDYIEACDRRQATRYEIQTGVDTPFLIQATTIAKALHQDLVKIGLTKNWCHFRNKTLLFSCKRHVENYPTDGIGKMLKFRGTPCMLPKAAEVASSAGQVFTKEDKENDRLDIILKPGKMVIRGEGQKGWSEYPIDMAYEGEPVAFRLSPQMLMQLVKTADKCEIGPGKLRIAGDRWCYVALLGSPVKDKPQPVTVGADEEEEDGDSDNGD